MSEDHLLDNIIKKMGKEGKLLHPPEDLSEEHYGQAEDFSAISSESQRTTIPIVSGNFPSNEEALKILQAEGAGRRAAPQPKKSPKKIFHTEKNFSQEKPQIFHDEGFDLKKQGHPWQVKDKESQPRSLKIPLIVSVLLILVMIGGIIAWNKHKEGLGSLFADSPTESSAPAVSVSVLSLGVNDLQPGQCVANWVNANNNDQKYVVMPCNQPHNAEVFYVEKNLDLGGPVFPGEEVTANSVNQLCQSRSESMKIPEADISKAKIAWTQPTPESFATGDRRATCFFITDAPETNKLVK